MNIKELTMKNEIRMLKALGDETRLRIICLLMNSGGLCVCEIKDAINGKQSAISKALKTLKDADLISDERIAQWKYYSLNKKLNNSGFRVIKALEEDLEKTNIAKADAQNLKKIPKKDCTRR